MTPQYRFIGLLQLRIFSKRRGLRVVSNQLNSPDSFSRGRDAQWRPRTLRTEPLKEAVAWLDQYRQFWEQSLDRLEEYISEIRGP